MFAQFFASFTRIAGFVKAFWTSSFTALHSSAQNFWMFLKFSNFFLICSFHKNHRFSGGLSYLPVYCFSLMQWIFIFFCNFCNCMQTWTYVCILVVYTPIYQKPKKVGSKLGKFTLFYYYCVSLFIGKAVSMESTWWSALQILTSKGQACESNGTLHRQIFNILFCPQNLSTVSSDDVTCISGVLFWIYLRI